MHNKQFLISKTIIDNEEFRCVQLFNGFVLNYHKELNVVTAGESVLLGQAFQCDSSKDIPEIELQRLSNPIEQYATWNGRWVLIYKNEIHPDASAQLGVFYGKIDGELVVSSSLSLISEAFKGRIERNEYMPLEYNLLLSWVPGPYTVIKGINRLLSTQYLTMDDEFEVHFRNPISKTDFSSLSVDEIYDRIIDLQKGAFRYIEKYDFSKHQYSDKRKNTFNIGLTAGYDSRMQATIMKKIGIEFTAHTFERRKSTESADMVYPRILANILDVKWDYIPMQNRLASRVIEYNRHTYDSVKDRDWKWHYTCGQYDKVEGNVIVSNSIWEAFSDYYITFGSTANLSDSAEEKYKDLLRIFNTIEGNPLAEQSFLEYIEWVDNHPVPGLSWSDRIAFEQLMGIWDGNENQGKDLFAHDKFMFNPANAIEIFSLIVALPKEKRTNRQWERELANMLVPKMKSVPYNTASRQMFNYAFPYDEEIRGKKVILYGAGLVGRSYYLQIMTQKICDVVAWVDKDYLRISESGILVGSVELVTNTEYDFLIVAVESNKLFEQILSELLQAGVDLHKILWEATELIDECAQME